MITIENILFGVKERINFSYAVQKYSMKFNGDRRYSNTPLLHHEFFLELIKILSDKDG